MKTKQRKRDQDEKRKAMHRDIDRKRKQDENRKAMNQESDRKRDQEENRKAMHRDIDKERDQEENRKTTRRIVEDKRRRNPIRQSYIKQWRNKKVVNEIATDTGFNFKCSCCLQFKGVSSCKSIDKLNEEEKEDYLILDEITESKDKHLKLK